MRGRWERRRLADRRRLRSSGPCSRRSRRRPLSRARRGFSARGRSPLRAAPPRSGRPRTARRATQPRMGASESTRLQPRGVGPATAVILLVPGTERSDGPLHLGRSQLLRELALPPLRPAAFFCAVVPPCRAVDRLREPEPDFLPPRLEAPGELAIFAARSLDMPFSFNFSYCFSFFTLAR